MNKAQLIGNLGRDPDVRHAQDGTKIVSFSIATSESWKDKDSGERKERTEWHRVVIFNEHIGGVAEQYLKKGSKVFIEGQMRTREWTDQSGAKKYTTEVVISRFKGELELLGSANGNGHAGAQSESDYGTTRTRMPSAEPQRGGWEPPADLDDEIPF